MNLFNNIFSKLIASREITGRVHALSALQRLNDDCLRDLGYSPEMVSSGLAGWPWRNETATEATTVAPINAASRIKPSTAVERQATADAAAELGHAA